MGCEREAPDCASGCSEFERIGGTQENKRLDIRFVCGKEDAVSWDEFGERKGRMEQSGH
ncbi:MAG: hypothetical protein UV33_C0035G0005 [Candidatus Daviesbacteria bacterium GW2011_GWA1_42_6]|uniref:Uncharacterized protein n=1 Tax=Candidatus Daviesbacteria bacterium GW2011_GWA1_42_6 TaxID=1618420 RepID=A0A0G1CZX8_9BACT|nr:MAG: hypothetical protein UV33_C0035G0005 [Candidatus Daviesbacteria bacterium GW2011_GWA1_42_6]